MSAASKSDEKGTARRLYAPSPPIVFGHERGAGRRVRTFIRELAPPDPAGVSVVIPTSIIDDARGYAYFYVRDVATWYVVHDTGLGR
jgi:hypothetical protein